MNRVRVLSLHQKPSRHHVPPKSKPPKPEGVTHSATVALQRQPPITCDTLRRGRHPTPHNLTTPCKRGVYRTQQTNRQRNTPQSLQPHTAGVTHLSFGNQEKGHALCIWGSRLDHFRLCAQRPATTLAAGSCVRNLTIVLVDGDTGESRAATPFHHAPCGARPCHRVYPDHGDGGATDQRYVGPRCCRA